MEEDNLPLGSKFADVVEGAITQAVNVPIINRGIEFLGASARFVDRNIVDPLRYASEQGEVSPEAAIGTVIRGGEYLMEKAEEGSQRWSEILNVDPRITGTVGPAIVETALTAGAGTALKPLTKVDNLLPPGGGMTPALTTAGGMAAPAQVVPQIKGGKVFMSTTSPEFTAKGMGQDVSKTPKFAPAVKIYTERGEAYANAVKELQKNHSQGKIDFNRLKKTLAKIEKIRKGDASTFEYDPKNPYAYKEGFASSYNPFISTPEFTGLRKDAPRGTVARRVKEVETVDPYDTAKVAQQHHILAKGETKPFADTLMSLIKKGVADEDDLVNFFVWPEQYDLFPGNVVNNLLDMGEITHTTAKKDPMALHTLLNKAGLEFGAGTEKQIIKRYGLSDVQSADDLMKAYDRYLQEIAVPSRDITYKVHDLWYDKTIKKLKGKELQEFKQNYSKLSDPRKRR